MFIIVYYTLVLNPKTINFYLSLLVLIFIILFEFTWYLNSIDLCKTNNQKMFNFAFSNLVSLVFMFYVFRFYIFL